MIQIIPRKSGICKGLAVPLDPEMLRGSYRVLPKKTPVFDWTVLETPEELDAVLQRGFRVPLPGSEIARTLSENVSCSRTIVFAK